MQTNANPNDLKIRILRLKDTIEKELKKLGEMNIDEIKQSYLDYRKIYEEKQHALSVCDDSIKRAKEGVTKRVRTWNKIKEAAITSVSGFFNRYMSQKGHQGRIEITEGELKFIIHMATHGTTVSVKDAKSLSGGEKSFTTVSFLLAIWELVETPFRA